jgi:hypothetical protein
VETPPFAIFKMLLIMSVLLLLNFMSLSFLYAARDYVIKLYPMQSIQLVVTIELFT